MDGNNGQYGVPEDLGGSSCFPQDGVEGLLLGVAAVPELSASQVDLGVPRLPGLGVDVDRAAPAEYQVVEVGAGAWDLAVVEDGPAAEAAPHQGARIHRVRRSPAAPVAQVLPLVR